VENTGQPQDEDEISSIKSNSERALFIWLLILRLVERGEYNASIARTLRMAPQATHPRLRKLEKYGYIERVTENGKRSYPAFYRLRDKGKCALQELSSKKRRARFRFHHHALRYKVIRDNPDFLPVSQGNSLRGGVVTVDGRVDGFSVRRFHSPSADWLFLYSEPRMGDLPWQLLTLSSIELDRLAQVICSRYNMELSFEKSMQKPEFENVRDPLAKFWGDYSGSTIRTASGSGIDASTGDWAEEFTIEDAVHYVNLARNVADITTKLGEEEQRLDVIAKGSVTMAQRMNTLTDATIMQIKSNNTLADAIKELVALFRKCQTCPRNNCIKGGG
jgi:DNA-binding MarR family transcriptional regulator